MGRLIPYLLDGGRAAPVPEVGAKDLLERARVGYVFTIVKLDALLSKNKTKRTEDEKVRRDKVKNGIRFDIFFKGKSQYEAFPWKIIGLRWRGIGETRIFKKHSCVGEIATP